MVTVTWGGDGGTREGAGLRWARAWDGFPSVGQEALDLVKQGSSDGSGEIREGDVEVGLSHGGRGCPGARQLRPPPTVLRSC